MHQSRWTGSWVVQIDGLVQERRNSSALAIRVLASPKFLPTDSDLCASRIRRTDRPRRKNYIIYYICYKCTWDDSAQTRILCFQGFFFFFLNHSCTNIAAIEAISFTAECGKSVWPYMKRMVNKQKGKIKPKHWMSENGSMLHYQNKNRYEKLFCRHHM